jgi:hypothetical protein
MEKGKEWVLEIKLKKKNKTLHNSRFSQLQFA